MAARSIIDQRMAEPPDPALDVAAEWKAARAEARLFLARWDGRAAGDRASNCRPAAVAEMEGAARWLATLKPTTIRGACEMLDVAVEILAYRETHSDRDMFGDGPILLILQNIREALIGLDAHTSTEP